MKKLLVLGATQYVMVNKECIVSSDRPYRSVFHGDNARFAFGK